MEHFAGGEMERKEPTPELQIVPEEHPVEEKRKFPEGIANWPDIEKIEDGDPLPGQNPEEKRAPTLN